MVRLLSVLVAATAAALAFATPAAAEPCGDGMASLEYALAVATGNPPADQPGTPFISDAGTPCACGGWRAGPCQCWVYCTCLPMLTDGDPGGFIDCSQTLLRLNCPGAPLDQL